MPGRSWPPGLVSSPLPDTAMRCATTAPGKSTTISTRHRAGVFFGKTHSCVCTRAPLAQHTWQTVMPKYMCIEMYSYFTLYSGAGGDGGCGGQRSAHSLLAIHSHHRVCVRASALLARTHSSSSRRCGMRIGQHTTYTCSEDRRTQDAPQNDCEIETPILIL